MRHHNRKLACILAAAILGPAATAHAGPPGKWTQVTGIETKAVNTDELGLFRTGDGVLHVAYVVKPGAGANESAMHRTISKDAKTVSGPETIATLKTMNNSIALVAGPGGGLRAFFAGLEGDATNSGFMRTATSDAAGKAWSPGVPASNNTAPGTSPVYAGAGISAVLAADGTPVSAWGDSAPGAGGYHVGLDPSVPDTGFAITGCCAIDPALARDGAGGALFAGFYSNGTPEGTQVLRLGGARVTAPNSTAMQTQDRVALTGRLGGKPGMYLAYVSGTNQFLGTPALWKVGDANAKVIAGQRRGQNIAISPTADGRLWVFWTREGRVVAARTNRDATKLGALVKVNQPSSTVYRLIGDGTLGPLDVLGLFDRSGSGLGYYHQRILPGLTLTASPAKVAAGKKFTFKLTDAGDPVKGAKVALKLGIKTVSGKTGAGGSVKLKVPTAAKAGTRTATATKPGYAAASAKVKVK